MMDLPPPLPGHDPAAFEKWGTLALAVTALLIAVVAMVLSC